MSEIGEIQVVDVAIIDSLIQGLTALKTNGGCAATATGEGVFWFQTNDRCDAEVFTVFVLENSPDILDRPIVAQTSSDADFAAQYQSTVRQLKTARDAFTNLASSLDEEIKNVHDILYFVYLRDGIATLPDEVLSIILEFACNDMEEDPYQLAHVCQRFHDLMCRMPHLWTTISTIATEDHRKLALTSSRDRLLNVKIDRTHLTSNSPRFKDVMRDLRKHKHRWELCSFAFDSFAEFRSIERLKMLHVPNLRELEIVHATAPLEDDDGDVVNYTFFETWRMPSLVKLKTRNIIPRTLQGMSPKSCQIELCTDMGGYDWDLTQVHAMLATCPLLEHFSISFCGDFGVLADFTRTELPRLRTLAVSYTDVFGEFHTDIPLEEFMDALVTPNITDLTVFLDTDDEDVHERVFRSIFNGQNEYRSLRTLNVTINRLLTTNNMLDVIFSRLPQLQHFSLEAPGIGMLYKDIDFLVNIPPLQTLTFTNCMQANSDFVTALAVRIVNKKNELGLNTGLKLKLCAGWSRNLEPMIEILETEWGVTVEYTRSTENSAT